ncbi:MAG: hypothetical protein H7X74_07205, partial [Methyloceanibacter sp.]|nr:hypothetical protein [Methyloceanibacter sp.]
MRSVLMEIGFVLAVAAGLGAGYVLCGIPTDWYAIDVAKLGKGAENDLIRYGRDLIVNTPRHIGKNAADPAMRFAGNDLACQSCHLNAGLQPFAAPFVSTFATFPMLVDDQVLTLTERINGCMRRSLNGKDLPAESREMEALIAYFKFVGKGTPEGCASPAWGSSRSRRQLSRLTQDAGRRSTPSFASPVTRRTAGVSRAETLRSAMPSHRSGGGELQRGRRHGQDRLCRRLYP